MEVFDLLVAVPEPLVLDCSLLASTWLVPPPSLGMVSETAPFWGTGMSWPLTFSLVVDELEELPELVSAFDESVELWLVFNKTEWPWLGEPAETRWIVWIISMAARPRASKIAASKTALLLECDRLVIPDIRPSCPSNEFDLKHTICTR